MSSMNLYSIGHNVRCKRKFLGDTDIGVCVCMYLRTYAWMDGWMDRSVMYLISTTVVGIHMLADVHIPCLERTNLVSVKDLHKKL